MRRLLAILVLVIAGLTTASVAGATTASTFVAVLSPVAGCGSGHGVAIVTVTQEGTLEYRLISANLQNVTMAHIHRSDTGGGVAWLYNPSSPVDVDDRVVLASGTITTADLTIASVERLAELLLDQTDDLSFYVNVHTTECPNGAIAGDLLLQGDA
jgi:CHRD domain